jgi:cell division septal protein FtsQ
VSDQPTPEVRRTVIIGDDVDDVAPGTGIPQDPLWEPPRGQVRGPKDPSAPTVDVWAADSAVRVVPATATTGSQPAPHGEPAEASVVSEAAPSGIRTIVIGADDGLPDATYTVSTVVTPESPRGPRVHPRLKARRIAVRQAKGRRRIMWLGVAGAVVALGLVAVAVAATPLFGVTDIRLSGVVNTNQADIAAVTRSIRGKPILTADLNAVARRLEALPWIRYASVTMDFPHTVKVQIAERVPVAAFYSTDNQWRVIDIDGRVIAVLAGRPIDYPAIFGPGPVANPGDSEPVYAKVAQFITALPPRLRPLVQDFEMDQAANVTMTLRLGSNSDTLVDLCAAQNLAVEQLVALTAFIDTKVTSKSTTPSQITACKPDLITASNS